MMEFNEIRSLFKANASFSSNKRKRIRGFSIDSRTLKKGDCFIALKGKRFDGHYFIEEAIKKGAGCVIFEEGKSINKDAFKKKYEVGFIEVKNTVNALGVIAHYHRMKFNIPIIGITGSSGKSTVKEIIYGILSLKYRVLKSKASYNNLIGLPLTLLNLKRYHEVCVLEMGTNVQGEIKRLSEIALPTMGVLTNIGDSHLKGLKNRSVVFRNKRALIDCLDVNAHAFLNSDDKFIKKMASKSKRVYYGIENKKDVYPSWIKVGLNGSTFMYKGAKFKTCLLGRHNIYNILCGIAVSEVLNVSLKDTVKAVRKFRNTLKGRMELYLKKNIRIIDDSYNANPLSVKAALSFLADINKSADRSVFIFSDMKELGKKSMQFHAETGKMIVDCGVDMLVTFGEMAEKTAISAIKNGMSLDNVHHFKDFENLRGALSNIIKGKDIVLVKGSRSMKAERAVDILKNKRIKKGA